MREVAEQAKVSPRTALRWANTGTMPAKKLGGTWRISPEALAAFLGRDPEPQAEKEGTP